MLNRKVVVVTGGAGLIGRTFVRCIVENNGIAIVADVNEVEGSRLLTDLGSESSQDAVTFAALDITNKDSIADAIAMLHGRYGKIDAVVNNAYPRNANYGRKFEDVTYEDFCENVSRHLGGYFLTAQQFVKYFEKQKYGSIVNMASVYGVIAPRFGVYAQTAMTMPVEYAAIKSAVIHLTRYLAQYLKGKNIRVNSISPGGIKDAQPAQFLARYNAFAASKGMLDATDLTGALLFLLSDMSKYVNGQNIVVDDGWTL